VNIINNQTGELQEGDTRIYTNDKGNKVRQIYKCKHRVPGMETSILCNRNQHGCIGLKGDCKRKELIWITKL